jgi:hypothetical protein
VRCFIIVLNVFRLCVTLGNRVHDICTETGLKVAEGSGGGAPVVSRVKLGYLPLATAVISVSDQTDGPRAREATPQQPAGRTL